MIIISKYITSSLSWLQEEAKTRDTFTEDGLWCKTGDMGILDADGHLKITGTHFKENLIDIDQIFKAFLHQEGSKNC